MNRRDLLRTAGLGAALGLAGPSVAHAVGTARATRPPRLQPGGTVGLISPAGVTLDRAEVDGARASLAAMGLGVVVGRHALDQVGYFAGTDRQRADDVNRMFADDRVDGILTMRGGWGCARILPFLEYDLIAANPKVLCGFSDVTSLLLAVHARTGLVTFHGPHASSSFEGYTGRQFRSVVVRGDAARLENPDLPMLSGAAFTAQTVAVRGGTARGPLLGGNLSVLASMAGTPYLPSFDGAVLFVEDIGEGIYRIDRMLTQLGQAGLLSSLAGFVFGACRRCDADSGEVESFTLEEVVRQHIEPLGVPAYMGAAIGHLGPKMTVPVGVEAEVDADAGTIRLLSPAVA